MPDRQAAIPLPDCAESAIYLHNVGVCYRLPSRRAVTLKDQILLRLSGQRMGDQEFWALHDITLSFAAGESVAIMGRNGAGKTSLLKLITRILRPQRGTIQVCGLVAPLMGVGAGFSLDLTGRENIVLQGSMLGFSRRQMQALVDGIIEFSELEDFIDAPLYSYSAGMQMRLGFSIVTSIRPDILLIDEVLAVGDAPFRAKCLERIKAYKQQGATIIVVSHAPETLRSVCDRGLWIEAGQIRFDGSLPECLAQYNASLKVAASDMVNQD